MAWSGLCSCGFPIYFNNPACANCMAEKAKQERTTARTQAKQANTLQKAKERSKGTKTAIKPVSQKQAKEAAELSRIKAGLLQDNGTCIACGTSYDLSLSHVITRKEKRYVTDPRNLVLLCLDCHQLYEHDKPVFKAYYEHAWNIKLERAKQLSEQHYQQLKDKAE